MLDAKKLEELKNSGKLSEEEYKAEKTRLVEQVLQKEEGTLGKSGIIYILLAWFLGTLGLHNFYAGFWGKGLTQLLLTIVAPWFLYIPLLIVSIWAFGELLFVNKGANKVSFRGNRKAILILRILSVIIFALVFSYSNLVVYDSEVISVEQPIS